MTGLEGPALSLALKAAAAAGTRFVATDEFDRLCARLAERFGDVTPLGAGDYRRWAQRPAVASALERYLEPPHVLDREGLIAAITECVGALDAETTAEDFARMVVDALPDEIRRAKQGDALARYESDRVINTVRGAFEASRTVAGPS